MLIMVTGGCGFIGSAVVRRLLRHTGHGVLNVDKLTYAASFDALEECAGDPRHVLAHHDVADAGAMRELFARYRPDAVMHLAAETHVDRSITGPSPFIHSNVVGTANLLQAATEYWRALAPGNRFRFHHVSTDEVFGALGDDGPPFMEASPYDPRSPYAASKAASDHLVRAWWHTYRLPVVISNTCNNYGPWQFPEKLIPLLITHALRGEILPIYGDGLQRRDWLHVEDHAEALLTVLEHGRDGETYTIGARTPRANGEVADAICRLIDKVAPDPAGSHLRLLRLVTDRPGHDRRYEINPLKAETALNWRPRRSFQQGIRETVEWYLTHRDWWEAKM